MKAPDLKQVNDFCEAKISFPKRPDLDFFSEKYVTYADSTNSYAIVRLAPEAVDIKSASYSLNETVATATLIVDASTHVTTANDIVYGYMLIEAGAGRVAVKLDLQTDLVFGHVPIGGKELFPITLGYGGADITVTSTVASDVIKVTLFGENITLDANEQFAGAS